MKGLKIKTILRIAVFLASICFFSNLIALTKIKVAVLDNPRGNASEAGISNELKTAYVNGINTAVELAKEHGYEIVYKPFFYNDNLLETLKMINKVNAWAPDMVVGLHNSNQLLIAKNYLKDTLVVSLYASDENIKSLPNNFYSLGVPDQELVKVFVDYFQKNFPKMNIFMAVEADSKETSDMANLFKENMKKRAPDVKVNAGYYIHDDMKDLSYKKFLKTYHKPSAVLVLSIDYYTSALLMSKIAKTLNEKDIPFVTSVDNWSNAQTPTQSLSYYKGFRITPFVMNPKTKVFYKFSIAYMKKYGYKPKYQISYTIYNAIFSAIKALQCYPSKDKSIKKRILESYNKALAFNSDWFRPSKFSVYQMTPGNELLLKKTYPIKNSHTNNFVCFHKNTES